MKKLLTALFALSLSFTPVVNATEYLARVTYYWTGNITSTGERPICSYTLAVDPKIIPYGSKVHIPEMNETYVSADTGPAVVARTAAKKLGKPHAIVVDVFCSSKAKAQSMIKKYPMFMKVIVEKK